MIVDLESSGRERFEAEVCVIGAGAAGITLARQLAARGTSVVLLESGGLGFEPEVQKLSGGENVGHDYSLEASRLRYFGGSTNHWEGYCGPLEESDFQEREWVRRSGWPLEYNELMPYWKPAHDVLDLGPFEYELPAGVQALPLDTLETCVWRHSPPTRFNQKYQDEIRQSDRITCVLHANLLRMRAADAGRLIREVAVGALSGASAVVSAQWFVLACGGIENARVLLLAAAREDLALERVAPVTGRFFMEHLLIASTATLVATGDWWHTYQRFAHQGHELTPGIRVGQQAQREHAILQMAAMIRPIDGLPGVLPGNECLAFFNVSEQAPNPNSRVRLGNRTDALGQPVVEFDWRLSEIDRRTVEIGPLLLARELGRLRLGRVKPEPVALPSVFPSGVWGANHHMGTTRMGDDGVVDRDCRVHNIQNLFVAGSSVFPTGGWINPTLTIVALAFRLAEHLAQRL